jgi:hypothetical protein
MIMHLNREERSVMSDHSDTAETNLREMVVRLARIGVLTVALATMAVAGPQTTVTVTELSPEDIPVGTCTESRSGYLGIVGKDKQERTKLTDQEIGEYVRKKLAEGYSVALYPQASGKMFTVQTCHPTKP